MSCFSAAPPLSDCLAEAPHVSILHVVPPSRFVAFAPPPACLRRDPVSRVPRGRASHAQGALLPSVPLGDFRTGARRETKRPPDAASSCPILPQICRSQTNLGIISKLMRYPINWERDKRYANTVAPAPGAGAQSSLMPRLRETGPRIAADAASGATRGVSQASVQNDRTLLQWVVTSQAKPEPTQPVSSCFGLENFGFDIGPEARYRGEAAESGFAC